MMTEGFFQRFIQVIQRQAVQGLSGQFADRTHRRNDLVPTGFSQQRAVITVPQVLVAAAQVDDLHTLALFVVPGLFQVFLGRDDVLTGEVGRPVFLAFDDDNQLAGSSAFLI
ncbi:hypothetical protein D3C87_1270720 [compost metagenome]